MGWGLNRDRVSTHYDNAPEGLDVIYKSGRATLPCGSNWRFAAALFPWLEPTTETANNGKTETQRERANE